jgi:transcriptional regulator GlxA family with amidase domain
MRHLPLPEPLGQDIPAAVENGQVHPDLQVGFILAPKFTLIAFASFIECLRHAADEADRSRQIHCRWSVIHPTGAAVEASCGMMVSAGAEIQPLETLDYVVVVGGALPDCLELPPETYDYLRKAHALGTPVVGICTGSFILAQSGLLDGRKCAVHIDHRHQMVDMYPAVIPAIDRPYANDGGVLTCPGGPFSWFASKPLPGNGCEFSARLLSQRPASCLSALPTTFIAAP